MSDTLLEGYVLATQLRPSKQIDLIMDGLICTLEIGEEAFLEGDDNDASLIYDWKASGTIHPHRSIYIPSGTQMYLLDVAGEVSSYALIRGAISIGVNDSLTVTFQQRAVRTVEGVSFFV